MFVEEEVLKKLNYDNSIHVDEKNSPIKFNNKSRDLNSKQYKEEKNNRLKKTKLDNYDNIIYKMLKDKHDYKTIYAYIHYKGYDSGDSALDHHIYSISKNNFSECYPKAMKFIKRFIPKM